jgi:hypothetical protein
MTLPPIDSPGWPATPRSADDDAWPSPRTQVAQPATLTRQASVDDDVPGDIGRLVGNDQRELFVSCSPVEALLQQFDLLHPEFITLHDMGCSVSKHLLASVASASGRRVQTLTIRRQGYGTPLATLEFIEWPSAPAGQGPTSTIRIYSTEVDSDAASRQPLAQVLLANSRLGVIFVGDLPQSALAGAFEPVEQALMNGEWRNRNLLMVPLSVSSPLANMAARLGAKGVSIRTTPGVAHPAAAWAYLSTTWNRLREQMGSAGQHLPMLASVAEPARGASSATSLPMQQMPELSRHAAPQARLREALGHYMQRLGKLNGMRACCIFDGSTSAPLAMWGEGYDAETLSREGHVLLDAMSQSAEALGLPLGLPEMAITLESRHLLLRPVPGRPELLLLALIDKEINLTLLRLQVQRLDDDVG